MKKITKIMFMCLAVMLLTVCFCLSAGAISDSGSCGNGVKYLYYDDTKELYIYGNGDMYDYTSSGSPFYKGDVETVYIGEGVTGIGDYAFYKCENLEAVILSDGLERIGNSAFCRCSSLWDISLTESLEEIGEYAFSQCFSLISISVPENVSVIPRDAFSSCIMLNEVILPDSLTEIGYSAFNNCYELENIEIPETVEAIGTHAFYNCRSLKALSIPEGVTDIGANTFNGCSSLATISLPSGLEAIDEYAFYNCVALEKVIYNGTADEWDIIFIDKKNDALNDEGLHMITVTEAVAPTCSQYGYTEGKYCSACETWVEGHKTISKKSHIYKEDVVKATLTSDGKFILRCSCGATKSGERIAKVNDFSLSVTDYVYNGKNRTPKVTVRDDDGNQLVKNVDYKTSVASSRSNIGKYYVKVTLMGNYSGEKKVYFYIRPGAPTTLETTQSSTWVKLSWGDAVGAYGYSVYRYDADTDSFKKLKSTIENTYTDKNLESGTNYTYKIIAYGRSRLDNVYYSKSNISTDVCTKTKTPSVTVTSSGGSKAVVKWNDVSGESGYQVWYSTSKDGTYKRFGNAKANATSLTVTGLTEGKTYYFKVRTYITTDSGYVYSDYSTVKSVKISVPATAAPVITVTASGSSKVVVKWNDVSGESGYQVWYSTSKNGTYTRYGNAKANATSLTVTGLSSSTTYYFKVRTYITIDGGYAYSAFSTVKSVKTSAPQADYSPVIAEYSDAIANDFYADDDYYEGEYIDAQWLQIFTWYGSTPKFYYALHDINSDGIKELVISVKVDSYQEVINIFTSVDGEPVPLFGQEAPFGERISLTVYDNGGIRIYGSNSAFWSSWELYELLPGSTGIEIIESYDEMYCYHELYYEQGYDYYGYCDEPWEDHFHRYDDYGDFYCVPEKEYDKILSYYESLDEISPSWKRIY